MRVWVLLFGWALGCASNAGQVPSPRSDAAVGELSEASSDAPQDVASDAPEDSPLGCLGWAFLTPVVGGAHDAPCVLLADALCTLLARCTPATLGESFGELPVCRARLGYACARALRAPDTGSPEAYTACGPRLRGLTCDDVHRALRVTTGSDWEGLSLEHLLGLCRVPGARPDGAACAADMQCARGVCQRAGGTPCGRCAAPAGLDAPCEQPSATSTLPRCDLGLNCRTRWRAEGGGFVAVGNACAAFAAQGEPCPSPSMPNPSTSVGCLGGLHCTDGVCLPRLREGAPCDPSRGPGRCDRDQGLTCDSARRVCARGSASVCGFARDGQRCRFAFKSLRACVYPARCGGAMEDDCRLPDPRTETCP
jgi:hypothetical protein